MSSQTTGLRVAGSVFGLMALAQLMRLIIQPVVMVAGHVLPLWPSILAFLLLASLSYWLWQLTYTHT